jgi:ribonuclease VapC
MSDLVVDTSAAIALLTGEAIGGAVADAMDAAERSLMSAATLVELGMVLEAKLGPVGSAVAERFLRAGRVDIVEVDRECADAAIDGWRRYGKGRHQAGLNYGDCFVYALAWIEDAPIVSTDAGFAQTDLTVVDLA